MRRLCVVCWGVLATCTGWSFAASVNARRPIEVDDLDRIRTVSAPAVSPDGEWVAYQVSTVDRAADETDTDLWMTSWDGTTTIRLTFSGGEEHTPRWSPDGRWLAFLSSRGLEEERDQVWLLPRAGGEAVRVTELAGEVSDYAWAPDGARIALVVKDPSPDERPRQDVQDAPPRPIVIDRFQFKQDEEGYLGEERRHLYLLDLGSRRVEALTPGPFDEFLPSWSPDGVRLAFVSKRGEDPDRHNDWNVYVMSAEPGADARRVTANPGPDCDPDYWYEGRPVWSPDGASIAYLHGGPPELIWYGVQQVAVVPSGGGEARLPVARLDRSSYTARWAPDGSALYFLLEDDQSLQLARVPAAGGPIERLTPAGRVVEEFDIGPGGRIAVLTSTPEHPPEVAALDGGELRPLSRQNQELMGRLRLARTEAIRFAGPDGTEIHGFVVTPADPAPGRRSPAVLRIHGGPVSQYQHEFRFDWQILAARGYAVVAANPRGSSGRGEAFQRAIWADWGNLDAQDVLAAVDHAVTAGIADPERLGIGGWSYGGMLTNYVIARDRRFKAAVSGSSISNILAGYGTDQYVREYEQELGLPWRNLDGWLRVSFPFLHADRITTPTLFLCGQDDFNVPLLASEQMYQALRRLGVDTELVIYPGESHDLERPSFARDFLERSLRWYDRYLGGDG